MSSKPTLRFAAIVFALVVALAGLFLGGIAWSIGSSVNAFTTDAQQDHPHPGDDVAALLDYMNSPTHSYDDRNHAVWALGRLRDPRALPALEAAYTGEPCDHGIALCQDELAKAIKLCGGHPRVRNAMNAAPRVQP